LGVRVKKTGGKWERGNRQKILLFSRNEGWSGGAIGDSYLWEGGKRGGGKNTYPPKKPYGGE